MKGFTLIEVLVVVAILSIVIAAIYVVLNIANVTYNLDLGILDLQQNARIAMDWMIKELRESAPGDVSIGAGNDDITFDTPNESNIRYYLDTGQDQIIRKYPPGTERIIANDIGNLNFTLVGNLLEIQITARKPQTPQRQDLTFLLKEKVRLRNE
ncbi:MAG: prepilin-type N-terminal cleavage/methylation domain-containing protein [Candidatus Omnitrophota bacterium]|jgi:prepilin-type N-terminal cleavage/methylation domain-containing protein